MAVGKQLGRIGVAELIGTNAGDAILAVLPNDGVVGTPHLDDALIALVRDEDVSTVWQICVLHRRVELVGSKPGDAELAVLPDDVAATVHENDPIIDAAGLAVLGCGGGGFAGRPPGGVGPPPPAVVPPLLLVQGWA